MFNKLKAKFEKLEAHFGASDGDKAGGGESDEGHSHTPFEALRHGLHSQHASNRFHSFAPIRANNDAKWFVDGCGYMWAVSVALEEAIDSIWILDWWLSPELYLRRPPSANTKYRLDTMLLAAAERGVKVNIIIYKEIAEPAGIYAKGFPLVSSEHTKKALEIHPNISVFRHPDHLVSGQALESQFLSDIKKLSLKAFDLAKLPEDGLKALYGLTDDVILYWAHHEKLCLIDGKMAFMGGLDLCFGRWDTNSHPIADAHPTDINASLFPGQDYNNARVYDFEDVSKYDLNKLDRTISSRMGWSDLSICLEGPVVEDLRAHFVQRWNFIFDEKYDVKGDKHFEHPYTKLTLSPNDIPDGYYKLDGKNVIKVDAAAPVVEEDGSAHSIRRFHVPGRFGTDYIQNHVYGPSRQVSGMTIQLARSCTKWSNGVATEHSIANSYIQVIHDSQHFVYIENQFFITATDDSQHPVKNKLGAAIVERVVRAFQNGERYKVIVCMPAVPAFAGDLHADDSLGTRAIMKYQYNSICRGEHSIIGAIKRAGVPDPGEYILFYNLRNYDRINANETMAGVEKESGVSYADARKEHDDIVGAGYEGKGEGTGAVWGKENKNLEAYQNTASKIPKSEFDTVSACYMDGGPSIKNIPFSGSEAEEMNAFVSEELYIHSKILIADDRVVICGSANLNDRSQLGYHDSEIAVVIEDSNLVDSVMAGQPYQASKFAASLRRQLFRKHLGLLPFQDWTKPDANFLPINKYPNQYDWGTPSDLLVRDVLSHEFSSLWNGTASTNTEVFAKAFHCVPDDRVRNWDQYESFFQKLFLSPDKNGKYVREAQKYQYGHVVTEEFPGGISELKDSLDRVRGTLVEMPLNFMADVDFASGIKLNALTEEIYT